MSEKNKKASDDLNDPEVNPDVSGNESADNTEKEKKEKSSVDAEVKLKRRIYEKDQELEKKDKEIEKLKSQLEDKPQSSQAPDEGVINQLQAQIDQLSKQVIGATQGKKLLFRQPTAADLQDEAITFTARSVIYIVASYTDSRGLEQLPPHKLIVFNYAASDIRKDGREEEIKNFSQYTTNLTTEIEFLRSHPFYGITFSENTNEMMNEDTKQIEFRTRAATQLSIMAPEDVFNRARELGIPNYGKKSALELKHLIVNKMAEIYKKEAEDLQNDILRRRALGSVALQKQE